jgi:hypothetical protein
MADIPAHADFVASSVDVANDPPSNNTRGRTPANAGRTKTPVARGARRGRGRGGRPRTVDATIETTSEEDEADDQAREAADASQKRVRADTFEMETRSLRARAERLEAENALARAEREALTLRTADWHPEQGTFSARVISVSSSFGVRPELVNDIANKRFVAINMIRLCVSAGADSRDNETSIPSLVCGTIHFSAANSKLADYKNDVNRWAEGFANYIAVWGSFFGESHPETVPAMSFFLGYILRQRASFTAAACLDYAIHRTNFILRAQDEGPQLWCEIPPVTTSIYFTVTTAIGSKDGSAKTPAKSTRGSPEPNDSSTICKSFNRAKCTYASCNRRHECSKCASTNHSAKDCKQ